MIRKCLVSSNLSSRSAAACLQKNEVLNCENGRLLGNSLGTPQTFLEIPEVFGIGRKRILNRRARRQGWLVGTPRCGVRSAQRADPIKRFPAVTETGEIGGIELAVPIRVM
jgi:hypothetical protein